MPWNGCPRPPARRFTRFPLGAVRATGPWVPDPVRRTILAQPAAQADVGVRITGAARSSPRFWTAAVLCRFGKHVLPRDGTGGAEGAAAVLVSSAPSRGRPECARGLAHSTTLSRLRWASARGGLRPRAGLPRADRRTRATASSAQVFPAASGPRRSRPADEGAASSLPCGREKRSGKRSSTGRMSTAASTIEATTSDSR